MQDIEKCSLYIRTQILRCGTRNTQLNTFHSGAQNIENLTHDTERAQNRPRRAKYGMREKVTAGDTSNV